MIPDPIGRHRIDAKRTLLPPIALRVESVEAAAIGNELRPLGLEHFPDRLIALLGMGVRPGPHEAFVDQPGVVVVVGLEPQPRRKEAFAHEADLVLDLTFYQPAAGVQATGSTR